MTHATKITRHDMEEVKRKIILANTKFRPEQAAVLLEISVRTLYRLIDEGLIKAHPLRPGQARGMRIYLQAIEEYRQIVMGDDYFPLKPQHIEINFK